MMKIDEISDSIVREAKEKARDIIQEAKKDCERRKKDAEKRLDEKSVAVISEYESELNKLMLEKISSAELKAKKELQKEKENVADKIMVRAFSKLKKLKSHKTAYTKSLARLYKKGVEALGGDEFEIICSKDDLKIVKSIAGKKDSIKTDKGIIGGIIVKQKGMNIMVDLTFTTLASDRDDEAKTYIYHKLFRK